MRVDIQRKEILSGTAAGVEGIVALVTAPTEVEPTGCTSSNEINLFVSALANIGDPQISGLPVKAKPPGVAQAGRIDLITALPG